MKNQAELVSFEFLSSKPVISRRIIPENASKQVILKTKNFAKKKTYRKKKRIRIRFFFRQISCMSVTVRRTSVKGEVNLSNEIGAESQARGGLILVYVKATPVSTTLSASNDLLFQGVTTQARVVETLLCLTVNFTISGFLVCC